MNFDYNNPEWDVQMDGMGVWGYGFGGANPRSRSDGEYLGLIDFTAVPTFGGGGANLTFWNNKLEVIKRTGIYVRRYSHIMERTVVGSYINTTTSTSSRTVYRYNFTLNLTTGQLDSVRVEYIFRGVNTQNSVDSLMKSYQNDSFLMNKWRNNILKP